MNGQKLARLGERINKERVPTHCGQSRVETGINVIDGYGFEMSGTLLSHEGSLLPW